MDSILTKEPGIIERLKLLERKARVDWVEAAEDAMKQIGRLSQTIRKFSDKDSGSVNPPWATEERRIRIETLVRKGEYASLLTKEARWASTMLTTLPVDALRGLVGARPELWRTLIHSFLRQWWGLSTLPSRKALMTLVAGGPSEFAPKFGVKAVAELLEEDFPQRISKAAFPHDQESFWRLLIGSGSRRTWGFFEAIVLARFALLISRDGLEAAWGEVEANPDRFADYLPASNRSWTKQASTRRATSGHAQTLFTCLLLEGMFRDQKRGADSAKLVDSLTERLLGSELGDPRSNVLSTGWTRLREQRADLVEWFTSELVREDLALFFQHAMHEPERAAFWLLFVRSIRKTACFLCPTDRTRLAQAVSQTREGLAAFERTGTAQGNTSVFCILFDDAAVVEFSRTGNAAYFYRPRATFEAQILGPTLGREVKAADFKRRDIVFGWLRHTSGWQREASQLLLQCGVKTR